MFDQGCVHLAHVRVVFGFGKTGFFVRANCPAEVVAAFMFLLGRRRRGRCRGSCDGGWGDCFRDSHFVRFD